MRKRADNQKGFTLIEVLVAVAILGMVVSVISMSIIQVIRGTERNNTMVIALVDIEHAASFINQDLLMAQTTNLPAYPQTVDLVAGDNLTLDWTDYYGGNATRYRSLYYVSDTKLMRDYDDQVANIALYISEAEFSIDDAGELVTVTLTSSPESISGRSETKTYRVYPRWRPEGG